MRHAQLGTGSAPLSRSVADIHTALRAASGLRRSQSPAGFLHTRQRRLRLGQRTRTKIDARRLGRDRDLLTGRRIATLALLLRGLHANGELYQAGDPHLLRIPELLQHDLLDHAEHPLGLSAADLGAVSDGARELCLGQSQCKLLTPTIRTDKRVLNSARRTKLAASRTAESIQHCWPCSQRVGYPRADRRLIIQPPGASPRAAAQVRRRRRAREAVLLS